MVNPSTKKATAKVVAFFILSPERLPSLKAHRGLQYGSCLRHSDCSLGSNPGNAIGMTHLVAWGVNPKKTQP